MNNFYKHLKRVAQTYGNVTVEGVHKKINLADVQLAWEHERFSMRRMSAFTLSSLKSHKDQLRNSIFEKSKDDTLLMSQRNAKIIAEALGTYIYGNDNGELFFGSTVNIICLLSVIRILLDANNKSAGNLKGIGKAVVTRSVFANKQRLKKCVRKVLEECKNYIRQTRRS